jgi:hypothetical protein
MPPSFFVSMATAAKFIQPIPIFLTYLAPLDVDVVSYQVSSISVCQVTCYDNFLKLCRNIHRSVWHLLGVEQIQNGSHCHGNQGAKNVKFTPNFTNFCSLSNRFRFFWAYLVPLDVDVVPTRFHQFLFGE